MKNIYAILLASILVVSLIIILGGDVLVKEGPIYKEPSSLNIREIDVKPLEITSSYVIINITTYINYRGAETNNASMVVRAIDSNTRLLDSQAYTAIPQTNKEDIEKTMVIFQNLKVEKNADYELKILLFNNGSILDSGSVGIRGINILTPQSKKYDVKMSNMDFIIGGTSGGRVALKPNIYLENTGAQTSDNLKILVKAREADSNILADRTSTETGQIESEKTTIKEVQLNVPDEYNYMIVTELWKDDTLINYWERPILLAPTKTLPKESLEKKVNIEVSQFVRQSEGIPGVTPAPTPMYAATTTPPPYAEPGFEAMLAIIAISTILIYGKIRKIRKIRRP